MIVIGVDPGGRETGLVARHRDELLSHLVVVRDNEALYPASVCSAVTHMVRSASKLGEVIIAVEDVQAPNPHAGMVNVTGALGTAKVVGAVLATFRGALLIPPGGHGSGPIEAYPEPLRPTRGRGSGRDRLRHARSAWDVSHAAEYLVRRRTQSLA